MVPRRDREQRDQGQKQGMSDCVRMVWAQHHCKRPSPQYILARSQTTTPLKASVSNPLNTVAARVRRTANTVNRPATNVHSHALVAASLVGDSSIPRCGCDGKAAANSA